MSRFEIGQTVVYEGERLIITACRRDNGEAHYDLAQGGTPPQRTVHHVPESWLGTPRKESGMSDIEPGTLRLAPMRISFEVYRDDDGEFVRAFTTRRLNEQNATPGYIIGPYMRSNEAAARALFRKMLDSGDLLLRLEPDAWR